jgi:hypothetical protein
MAGAGYGSQDTDGSWGFKATADGKVILGNTSDDVIQVTGSLEIKGHYITAPTATDLGSGTSTTLTPNTSLHFLDADSVTLATGKDYFEITLADGTTAGQHLQLAITTAANNPVRVVGSTGGAIAQGTISFSGMPADGQGIALLNPGGSTTYTVTLSTAMNTGEFSVAGNGVTAGINGISSAADAAWVMSEAISNGIVSGWPFTLTGYAGGTTVTVHQATAGTSGNQTITENMDNATVSGFAGGTALVPGTTNSTYGVELSNAAGMTQGAHFVWDATNEQWQIIAGSQLTS